MKLGILTLTPGHNYGGILQAVALYSYLEGNGHDVELINKIPYVPLWKRMIFYILENIPFQNIKKKREGKIKSRQLRPFLDEYIKNKTDPFVSASEFKDLIRKKEYDAVIVGSDQVWRYAYINDGYYSTYFLDFGDEVKTKKIAYAASFGKDEWEQPSEIENISFLISGFNAISVREQSGIEICKNTFKYKGEVKCVLDPTMLMESIYYDRIIEANPPELIEAKLVTYMLDPNKNKDRIIKTVRSKFNLGRQVKGEIHLGEKKGHGKFYKVEEWLSAIKKADFVITDSFHGMVFSIIFNKQFLVIGNHGRGLSRFNSLLAILGLEQRLINECESELSINERISNEIDYKEVNIRIHAMRDQSACFLNQALSK